MADISSYINAINAARYGNEVRGSIATALTKVNDQVEDDTESAAAYAEAAAESAAAAAEAEENLAAAISAAEETEDDIEAAEALRVTAEEGRVSAEADRVTAEAARAAAATGYVAQAQAYAQQAQQYASSDYVKTAESWAIGGTSSRYGEDTNNAKYWAEIAAEVVTEGGVGSFNGRTGQVLPVAGDYDTTKISRGTGTAETALAAIENNIGSTTMGTTATTITGAIAEHETDITTLNSKLPHINKVGSADTFSYNFLLVNTTTEYAASGVNDRATFGWTSSTKSQYSSIPTALSSANTASGIREVIWINAVNILVRVVEAFPTAGRTHYNFYNSGSWSGWKTITPT